MTWLFSILIVCVALASVVGGSNKPGKSKLRRGNQFSLTSYNNNSSTDTFWGYDSNSNDYSGSDDNSYSDDSCSSSSTDSGSSGGDSDSCDSGF
jgi:hypothetical protein